MVRNEAAEATQEGAELGTEVEGTEVEETSAPKRARRLSKSIDGTVVKITVLGGEKGEMSFDTADLPAEVQAKLIPFGLGHKLGDAAAGESGKDAEEAITKVFEGLLKGDFTVRAPAAPKVSLNDVRANLNALPEEERAKAIEMLKACGITV